MDALLAAMAKAKETSRPAPWPSKSKWAIKRPALRRQMSCDVLVCLARRSRSHYNFFRVHIVSRAK
jgi:hypothetical protein